MKLYSPDASAYSCPLKASFARVAPTSFFEQLRLAFPFLQVSAVSPAWSVGPSLSLKSVSSLPWTSEPSRCRTSCSRALWCAGIAYSGMRTPCGQASAKAQKAGLLSLQPPGSATLQSALTLPVLTMSCKLSSLVLTVPVLSDVCQP